MAFHLVFRKIHIEFTKHFVNVRVMAFGNLFPSFFCPFQKLINGYFS